MCRNRSEEDAAEHNGGGKAEEHHIRQPTEGDGKTSVEKQSDLLNKAQLMEIKQERDERIRSYVAEGPGQHLQPHVEVSGRHLHRDYVLHRLHHPPRPGQRPA